MLDSGGLVSGVWCARVEDERSVDNERTEMAHRHCDENFLYSMYCEVSVSDALDFAVGAFVLISEHIAVRDSTQVHVR